MISSEDNFRILVIDDMKAIHDDFKKILIPEQHHFDHLEKMNEMIMGPKKMGKLPPFQIDCALQGEEGLTMARTAFGNKKPYAVAFVDVQMPPGEYGF